MTRGGPRASLEGAGDRLSVFISYAHADVDRRAARRLAGALRRLRLPRSVVGPGRPRRLHVFRDRDEGKGGELDDELREAVQAATVLVAICSPRAAASAYVGQEITWFSAKDRGATDGPPRIVPVLVRGDPTVASGSPEDPFHSALRAAFRTPWALDLRPVAPWTQRVRDALGFGSLTGIADAGSGHASLRSVEPDTTGRVAIKVAATALDREPSEVWDPLRPRRRARAVLVAVVTLTLGVLGGMGRRATLVADYRGALATGRPIAALEATRRLRLLGPATSDSLARRVLQEPVPIQEGFVPGGVRGGVFVLGGRELVWWTADSVLLGDVDEGGVHPVWSEAGTVVGSPAVSTDGGLVVYGSDRGGVRVLDVAERRAFGLLDPGTSTGTGPDTGPVTAVDEIAFDRTGGVVILDGKGRLVAWRAGRLNAPEPVPGLTGAFEASSMAVSPDGRWVAVAHRGILRVRADSLWRPLDTDSLGSIRRVVALDEDEVAVSASGGFGVVDVATGRIVALCRAPDELRFAFASNSGAFVLADGRRVQHRMRSAPCRVADAPSEADHESEVMALALSGDGSLSLTRDVGGVARIWDVPTGWPLGTLRSPAPLLAAAFDGSSGAGALTLDDTGRVRQWALCRYRTVQLAGSCGTPPATPVFVDSLRSDPVTADTVGHLRAEWATDGDAFRIRVFDGRSLEWTYEAPWRPWSLRWSAAGDTLTVLGSDSRVRRFIHAPDSIRAWADELVERGRRHRP